MLIFEYGVRHYIDKFSLVNHAPNIWRWTNPNISIADWLNDVYDIPYDTDTLNTYNFSGITVDNVIFIPVEDYESLKQTLPSFYWDKDNQIAYIHTLENPQGFEEVYLSRTEGACFDDTFIVNKVLYPNILLNQPTITQSVDPVTIGKMSIQSITVNLLNDEVYKIIDNKPVKTHRFDDLTNILGQETFLKYGNGDYKDFVILHKGVITDYNITHTEVEFIVDDIRARRDIEWPNYTYEDEGYTEENVGENEYTKCIPDGYGYNRRMPTMCVNKDSVVMEFDEDDEWTNPYESVVDLDLRTWSSNNVLVDLRNENIDKQGTYRLEQTSVESYIHTSFIPNVSSLRFSGYCVYRTSDRIRVILGDKINIEINFSDRTFNEVAGYNTRVHFIDDGDMLIVYFSSEAHNLDNTSIQARLYPDLDSNLETACLMVGVKITHVQYPIFHIARLVSNIENIYKFENDDYTPITPAYILSDRILVHECDAHTEGKMSNSLSTIVVDGTLRDIHNPFDIITDLNYILFGVPYISSIYDIPKCNFEKQYLADISLYLDEPKTFSTIIEDLQGSSTFNFRYDDVDKIYIKLDNPNRGLAEYIIRERILNEVPINGNMTLYADEVTVRYSKDRNSSDEIEYRNLDYQKEVLRRYSYNNPRSFDSMLLTKEDAITKSIVLLEDLSVTRRVFTVELAGLDILSNIELLDLIQVDLRLDDREYAGIVRAQIIEIEIDLAFDIVILKVRERSYSDEVAKLLGTGYKVLGTHTEKVLGSDIEKVIGKTED